MRDQMRLGAGPSCVVGALQISAAGELVAGLAVSVLDIAAAAGLTFLAIGAIATHERVDDQKGQFWPRLFSPLGSRRHSAVSSAKGFAHYR
ncbi:DoxX family protein [Mycolicibacterium arabiense]|uniref:DoxX family protein n=1 Tax=Mycolicibacterium arabiense TaxID=1286181 RepID=UPI0013D5F6F2|nr:DoxX family protein [Mycolicibacterium arabiense]MCV7372153.1 DoxX family protein [Mycolicibacterium arabiense]